MQIRSRPLPVQATVGNGQYVLKLNKDELYLIASLVQSCRLGQPSVYSKAAFNLCGILEREFGNDLMDDMVNDVDFWVTAEDAIGNVVYSTGPGEYATLEV